MADLNEVVLLHKACPECKATFFLCERCARHHRYCSRPCSRLARLRLHREANRLYQQTEHGRQDHRDRQSAYRERLAQKRVTDQDSLLITCPASSFCGPAETSSAERPKTPDSAGAASQPPRAPRIQPEVRWCCRFCGRWGRWINPFPPNPRRRR